MSIVFEEKTRQFHLWNDWISYVMIVQPNEELGQLYYGKRIHHKEDFSYLLERRFTAMVNAPKEMQDFSLELNRQEYPTFGTTDYRTPAVELKYENGSRVSHFTYDSFEIKNGKRKIPGLPATYVNTPQDAQELTIRLKDTFTRVCIELYYTIWENYPVICKSSRIINQGNETVLLERAMSLCLDLPDYDYDWMQFSGAWGRERTPVVKALESGITAIGSMRGHSSANQNPFVILKRKNTNEYNGEAIGFSFVYSGNFLAQAEVDVYGKCRYLMGIHPTNFEWELKETQVFDTPEVVMTWTENGLNSLSQWIHKICRNHLIRGEWKEKERPILLNNWEATLMDFDEESILKIAKKGKEAGVELFVLDDGWFGKRNDDYAGLGDWYVNKDKLPDGIGGLSKKINELGLDFGLWIEPEMVNEDSDLYRAHPDWVLAVPGRGKSLGRHQMVLDYSKEEVVDYIYGLLEDVLDNASISYIKWDMNRTISECYSQNENPDKQGTIYHRYILGVYRLYERLRTRYPNILFESCASGGSRFDAGMLYFAPQTWCSDDTDAIERLKIQYGTSYGYPIASIGAHVSESPNQQTGRYASIDTRGNVAYFGTFGYELDLNLVSEEEFDKVKQQIIFMKKYRKLIQTGDFYRLQSPFANNICSWMVVSEDKNNAILGIYQVLSEVNITTKRIKLTGLSPEKKYKIGNVWYYGDELMQIGVAFEEVSGVINHPIGDFVSAVYTIESE